MTDSLKGFQAQYLELFREKVLPVFSYHLARCGDWQDAQSLTRATFTQAYEWFDPKLVDQGQAQLWLFQVAVWVQLKEHRFITTSGEGSDQYVPSQEQTAAFVRVAQLAEAWSSLPRRLADGLALFFFGGLELEDAAIVVGWSPLELSEQMAPYMSDQIEVRLVARSLSLVSFFANRLEAELNQLSGHPASLRPKGLGPLSWRLAYRMEHTVGKWGRVVPLVLFFILLFWGIWYLSNPQNVSPGRMPTQTAAPTRPLGDFIHSTDSVLLADREGAIFQVDLTSGEREPIVPAGYFPYQLDENAWQFPPQVSPDGRWLKVIRQMNYSTWLFSFVGEERRVVNRIPLQLTWAPDSKAAYYFLPTYAIRRYDMDSWADELYVSLPGTILSMAVSPDSAHLAAIYLVPHLAGEPAELEIVLVDLLARKWEALVRLKDVPGLNSGHDLLWSEDGQEIWYPRYRMAVRLSDRKLHPLVSGPPYDPTTRPTFLNLLLHPSIAQPFLDQFGLEALLLGAVDPGNYLLTLGALSPYRSAVAMGYYNAQGVTGTLALLRGSAMERQVWSREFASIGRISWLEEGRDLIVAEREFRPGAVYRVHADTGRALLIDDDAVLLGSYSELKRAGLQLAPQMFLNPLASEDQVGEEKEVQHPGMGVSLKAPEGWKVWKFAENRSWGSLTLANFAMEGPAGFSSLGPEQLMVMISPVAWQDHQPVQTWLDQLIVRSGGNASYRLETLDGNPAYRLQYRLPDDTIETILLVETGRGTLGISMIPPDSSLVDVYSQVLESMHLEPYEAP